LPGLLFTTLAAYSREFLKVLLCYSPRGREGALVGTYRTYQQCDTSWEAQKLDLLRGTLARTRTASGGHNQRLHKP